jgi:hypothetical protein
MWSPLILGLSLGVTGLYAQTAQITGRITDPSGGIVPGARVETTETSTNRHRAVTTNEQGYYTIPSLNPGIYELTVEKTGFRAVGCSGMNLDVNQIVRLDFGLQVGGITEQVTVQAAVPLLDRETSSLGQVVPGRQILGLPLLGRNPYALGMLAPGVRTAQGMNNLVIDVSSTSAASINGGRNNMNSFLLDGAPNTSPLLNQPVIFANVDSVQEFKIDTNNFSAEYGRTAGGVFNVVTRSGTNDLHFTTYEFLRNSALNANDWFANRAGQPRAPFRLNQFGGVIGGPLVRNRTFVFASTELVRFAQGVTFTGTVPAPEQLSGDFGHLLNTQGKQVTIFDPLSARPNPNVAGVIRNPFPNNVITPDRIDPVAREISKYWPSPNTPGAAHTGVNNFVRTDSNWISKNTFSVRIDHDFTARTRAFFRYSYDQTPNRSAPAYGAGDLASPVRGPQKIGRYNAVAEVNRVFSPSLLAMLRVSFGRLENSRFPYSNGFDVTKLGFPKSLAAALRSPAAFPAVMVNGYSVSANLPNTVTGVTLGSSEIVANVSNDYGAAGSATKAFANHSLKFGGELRWLQLNLATNGGSAGFGFYSSFTQGPNPAQSSTTSGSALASFLLGAAGTPSVLGGSVSTTPFLALENQYRALFVEDIWKLRTNLTLTLGLRYDSESPRTERHNQLTNFDSHKRPPLSAPGIFGALAFVDMNGVPRYHSNPDFNNVSPRVGFAWSPLSKTMVRAAGGILYAPTTGISGTTSLFGISGFQSSTTMMASQDGLTPATFLSNPFPQGLNKVTGSSLGAATLLGQDIAFYDRGNVVPYMGQWNFDVQHELLGSVLFDIAYAGTRGLKFPVDRQLNQLPLSALALGDSLSRPVANPFFGEIHTGDLTASTVPVWRLLRPYPQFGQVTSTSAGWSSSRYHALQVKFEKRSAKGFAVLAAYTYSKLMDDSTGNLVGGEVLTNGTVQDWNNLKSEWSTSVLDQTHRLVFSAMYALPSWKRRQGVVGWSLSGWETGAILSVFTGAPLAISVASPNDNSLGGNQRPNWTGRSAQLSQPTSAQWFDVSQFSQPAPYTFGNTPRTLNGLRSEGVKNLDIGLNRTIHVAEKIQLQFRAEAFNLLNRPQFAPPNTKQGAPAFGMVTAMENSPRVFQFGMKLIH